jgi:predicted nucleic acid-binding protein
MTVVVADTSPLNYLILIDAIAVLPQMYGVVVAPRQVIAELAAVEAPDSVKTWASSLPAWVDVRDATVGDEDMKHLSVRPSV